MSRHVNEKGVAASLADSVSQLKAYPSAIAQAKKAGAGGGANQFLATTLPIQHELRDSEGTILEKSTRVDVAVLTSKEQTKAEAEAFRAAKGCELHLMRAVPDDKLKQSDETHLYLYRKKIDDEKDEKFFYKIKGTIYDLEGDAVHAKLKTASFNNNRCADKEIRHAVLDFTSKKGHTQAETKEKQRAVILRAQENRKKKLFHETRAAIGHLREIENKDENEGEIENKNEPVAIVNKKTGKLYFPSDHKGEYKTYQEPNKKRSTQFIQNLLFHGKKGKISARAQNDLHHWFHKSSGWFSWFRRSAGKKANEDLIREITAQVLMALDALHSNNKVHRDIKLGNFLIYKNHYVELADIDTISDIGVKTNPTHTPQFLAPEARSEETKYGKRDNYRLDKKKYPDLDKKALDCYAIGTDLGRVYDDLIKDKDDRISYGFQRAFSDLVDGLADDDKDERLTIQRAMESPLFGATPEARAEYFKSIREKYAAKDEYFDSYYRRRTDFYEADCKVCLMKTPSNNEFKESNKSRLYLYRDENKFFYKMGDTIHPLEVTDNIAQKLKKAAFEDIEYVDEEMCIAILSTTSKLGHTYDYNPGDAFFLMNARLKEITLQAESVKGQMEFVQTILKGQMSYALKEEQEQKIDIRNHLEDLSLAWKNIEKLKKSIAEYGNKEPKEILASLKANLKEAEKLLSTTPVNSIEKAERILSVRHVESYFAALEKTPKHASDLSEFLNSRTNEQKRIDLEAALFCVSKYIHTLGQNDPARKLLEPYWHVVENQKSHIPPRELAHVTELTHRLLHKAKHPDDPLNIAKGLEVTKRITIWKGSDIIKNLGMIVLSGILNVGAAVTGMYKSKRTSHAMGQITKQAKEILQADLPKAQPKATPERAQPAHEQPKAAPSPGYAG